MTPESPRKVAGRKTGFAGGIPADAPSAPSAPPSRPAAVPIAADALAPVRVSFTLNGQRREFFAEPRVTLLDALREILGLMGTKKGCDRGQCGACTVLANGRRINACLTLAVMHEGDDILTIEGIGAPDALHVLQRAFIEHDALQCGYCTPGQIMSALALIEEAKRGEASAATPAAAPDAGAGGLSDEELRERMSGNLCRCGAYVNIVRAIRAAMRSMG